MHSHDNTAGGPAAAASWFLAMILTAAVAVALIVALFVWAPWDDNSISPAGNGDANAPADQSGGDTNADGGDINIDPNVDINTDGGDAPQQ